jgi:hypothetical protein
LGGGSSRKGGIFSRYLERAPLTSPLNPCMETSLTGLQPERGERERKKEREISSTSLDTKEKKKEKESEKRDISIMSPPRERERNEREIEGERIEISVADLQPVINRIMLVRLPKIYS